MKTMLVSLIAALVAVAVLAGASLAQAPATPAPAKAAAVKSITGEFVAMDKTTKTVTVKYLVDKKPTQITLSVNDAMLASLGQLKAGDQVKVTYEELGGKFIAKTIVKA